MDQSKNFCGSLIKKLKIERARLLNVQKRPKFGLKMAESRPFIFQIMEEK